MARELDPKSLRRKRKLNRELVLRALTDRKFRRLLQTAPDRALGKRLTVAMRQEVKMVLATVRGIESQVRNIADELLCLNGSCGIA